MLVNKASERRRTDVLSANIPLVATGNLQAIKSDSTYRKIRSEAVAHLDRDKDDIWDLIQMQKVHSEYIQEVAVPFSVKLFSKEQLFILEKQKYDDTLPVIYFDATGNVVRKPDKTSKRVFLYSAVTPLLQTKRVAPVFEMISAEHFSKTIYKLFVDFRIYCEENKKWPVFGAVVTDFSFANIHAITKSCNRLNLTEYLNVAWDIVTTRKEMHSSFVTIHLCCAHFMKMVTKDISDHYSRADSNVSLFIKNVFAQCVQFQSLDIITEWAVNFYILIHSPGFDVEVERAYKVLKNLLADETYEDYEFKDVVKTDSQEKFDKQNQPLFKTSPFWKYFDSASKTLQFPSRDSKINPFYNYPFSEILLNKYLPYCPLWSGILIRECYMTNRFSNSYVENYFGFLKNHLLRCEKNLKPSRFIRRCRRNILAVHKEVTLGISKTVQARRKRKRSNDDSESEVLSQEIWKRTPKKIKTHFSGNFLKNLKATNVDIPESYSIPFSNVDNKETCLYCGLCSLDVTVIDWVQCDACDRWVHQLCQKPSPRSLDGSFTCNFCIADEQKLNNPQCQESSMREAFEIFLNSIEKTGKERAELEATTRDQRLSSLGRAERHKRLTCSSFGKIFKPTTTSRKQKLAEDISQDSDLSHIVAVKYGIEKEQEAVQKYISARICKYIKSGLVIHPRMQFLAGSLDGLINDDGVLEVKCPFKIRNCQLKDVKLDYLYPDKKLKMTHDYYYQVSTRLARDNEQAMV